MLELHSVSVRFGARSIFERVSLTVEDGEVVALTGPSGCGKSTMLRCIAGLQPVDEGVITWDANDLADIAPHQRQFGLVFQDDQLFPHLSVARNIEFGLRIQRRDVTERAARVTELLRLVGLEGSEARSVTTLSGGEAKRVALARALAPRPRLLLLDEPLTGLDAELHDRLMIDLGHILATTNTTAILVTHDVNEASALADRVVTLAGLAGESTGEPIRPGRRASSPPA